MSTALPRILLDSLPFGVLITDSQLRLLQTNRWLRERLGTENANGLSRPLGEVFPELQERNLLSAYKMVLDNRQVLTLSTAIHRYFLRLPARPNSGMEAMPQTATIAPLIENERLNGTITFIQDVSDRVLSERELQREIVKLQELQEELRRTNAQLETLLRATRLMGTHLAVQPLLDAVVNLVAEVFGAECVTFLGSDPTEGGFRVLASFGASEFHRRKIRLPKQGWPPVSDKGRGSGCILDLRQVTTSDANFTAVVARDDLRSLLCARVVIREELAGWLNVFTKGRQRQFTPEEGYLLEALAAQLSLALDNAQLYAQQQHLAVTDGLTGLANRRRFDEELERELKRALRYRQSTALIMLDIDDFKKYNDTYGHPTGDELLKALAQVLRRDVREIDLPARYGGEEFAVILPQTDLQTAARVAERLRASVAVEVGRTSEAETRQPPSSSTPQITISLGVAASPDQAKTPEELIRASDSALYQAKQQGKDQVVVYSGMNP